MIIGDSLTGRIIPNADIDVVTCRGAKVKDIKQNLQTKKAASIYLVAGTNDCKQHQKDPEEIVKEYRDLLGAARSAAS